MLIRIARTDWEIRRIPDKYVLLLWVSGFIGSFLFSEIDFGQKCVGFFAVSLLLLFVAFIVPGSIGGGDIKLMAAGGFLLGAGNIWKAFVVGIFLAGSFISWKLLTGKLNRKTEIALGPFLCTGMIWILMRI